MRNTSISCALGGAVCFLLAGFLAGCSDENTSSKPVVTRGPATSAPTVKPAVAVDTATSKQPEKPMAKPSDETKLVAADTSAKKQPEAAPAKTAAKGNEETTFSGAISGTGGLPAKTAAKGDDETMKVGACDGGDAVEVPKELKGQPLADNLMDQWKRNHPNHWVAEEKERHTLKPPADNADLLKPKDGQAKGDTYGNYTERDLLTWQRETEKFAAEGSRIFHSADELGSTVAVSCDMCHPHASNTHPETYPKFQVQLGRVVLLRDMVNWCIENPVRGPKLEPDGPKMRALEAYIMAQRKGVPMNYGKH